MMHVWHLIAADLRQHRWVVLAWTALVVGGAAAGVVLPGLELSRGQREAVEMARVLYGFVGVLLGTVLVALIVQSHVAAGTHAFWLTRPFPTRAVVYTKLILLGAVVVGLPAVAEVARALFGGVKLTHLTVVAAWFVLILAFWVALVAAAAAVTTTLTRCLLLCLGGVIVVILSLGVSVAIQSSRFEDVTYVLETSTPQSNDASLIFLLLTVSGGVGVVITQYVTRLRRYSIPVGVVFLLAALAVPDLWPWNLTGHAGRRAAWVDDQRPAVVLVANSISTRGRWWSPRQDSQWRQIGGDMRLEGVEERWAVQAQLAEASAVLPSGERLRSLIDGGTAAPRRSGVDDSAATAAVRSALGVTAVFDVENLGGNRVTLMNVPEDILQRIAPAEATYAARVRFTPLEYGVTGRLPIVVGGRVESGDSVTEVIGLRRVSNGLTARVRVNQAKGWHQQQYYLRNLVRSEAMAGALEHVTSGITAPLGTEVSGYSSQQLQLMFPRPYPINPTTPAAFTLDDEWLANAELVVVRVTQAAPFERRLTIPAFPINPPDPNEGSTR